MLIAVCIPTMDYIYYRSAMSLAGQMATLGADGISTMIVLGKSSAGAYKARNQCMEAMEAQEERQSRRFDYLMWFDTDMLFPARSVQFLLNRQKDIVGGTYVRREEPFDLLGQPANGKTIDVDTGLVEAAGMPTGIMLIKRHVFDKFKKPYWEPGFSNDGRDIGEDILFCHRAREFGFQVWLDVDLTKEVRHVGHIEYGPEHSSHEYKVPKSSIVRAMPEEVAMVNGHG